MHYYAPRKSHRPSSGTVAARRSSATPALHACMWNVDRAPTTWEGAGRQATIIDYCRQPVNRPVRKSISPRTSNLARPFPVYLRLRLIT